jgi:serine/threonine-protein kinase RIO1
LQSQLQHIEKTADLVHADLNSHNVKQFSPLML